MMLTPTRYAGQTVAVVLGGPSLHGYDFSRLAAHPVIAVNKAFLHLPHADMAVSIDNRFYESNIRAMHDKPLVMIDRVGWNCAPHVTRVPAIEGMPGAGPHCSLAGVSTGENSGFAATMLSLACGAALVFVLGLDLNPGGGWWHDGYPPGWGPTDAQLDVYRAWWEWAATFPSIRERIINCNPGSAVRGFERRGLP